MIFIGAGSVRCFESLGEESFPRHHLGCALDAVLDVLLHHEHGQRRHVAAFLVSGSVRLRDPGDVVPAVGDFDIA